MLSVRSSGMTGWFVEKVLVKALNLPELVDMGYVFQVPVLQYESPI